MTSSIPASQLVSVIPGVLGAGGNPLSLNAIMLTHSLSVPIGTVQPFSTLADVQAFFGASSTEATLAAIYFNGFNGATLLPGTLYFTQYTAAAVAGYLRSASLADLSLAQLQAFSGTLTVSVDGAPHTTASINLSGATSFSDAASLINSALATATAGATCAYSSQLHAFVITSATTGVSSAVSFASGTFATNIRLTSATGAVISAGADASVPSTFMAAIIAVTQNWALFMTTFEPILSAKLLFADWVTTTNDRFGYVCWDSDVAAKTANASGSFGALTADYDGVIPVWETDGKKAAFICGITASLNFSQTNGRVTYAFKSQPGLLADITDATIANNLIGNGYNFYGSYATANDSFTFLQTGQISGDWLWIDEYVNQIYLNAQLQLAFMELLTNVNSIPYNQSGYNLLRAAAQDPINEAKNFGTIRAGVTLSASQIVQLNTAAGVRISDTLQQVGYYLQILDASAIVRAARGSPPMTLWYVSGGSIQKINLASIDVL